MLSVAIATCVHVFVQCHIMTGGMALKHAYDCITFHACLLQAARSEMMSMMSAKAELQEQVAEIYSQALADEEEAHEGDGDKLT